MTSLSLSIQLSQCNSTGTESGNGGQFKREFVVKKQLDLFLKLNRNNWHGAFLPNIKSESRKNERKIFHRSSTLKYLIVPAACSMGVTQNVLHSMGTNVNNIINIIT